MPRLNDLLNRNRKTHFCLLFVGIAQPKVGKHIPRTSHYGFAISTVCHIVPRRAQENPAPEGRTSLAQRFSAGKRGINDSSPRGTTHCPRTLALTLSQF